MNKTKLLVLVLTSLALAGCIVREGGGGGYYGRGYDNDHRGGYEQHGDDRREGDRSWH